jgi:hypothetical protein
MLTLTRILILSALLGWHLSDARAQDDFDREPILYSTTSESNSITELQGRIDAGEVALKFEDHFGYLRSVLEKLEIPESSQMLVFSKTSLQRQKIAPRTPRSIYFSDDVYVGFCQSGTKLEISAADPQLGTCFYTLDQDSNEPPRFVRQTESCLTCHASSGNQGVPGHVVRSVFTDSAGLPMLAEGSYRVDQTTPLEHRWGGWYVTGTHGQQTHLGNLIVRTRELERPVENAKGQNVVDLAKHVRTDNFLTPHSDLIALMVLEHQAQAHNYLARANFLARQALYAESELNRELGEPANHRWDSTNSRIRNAGDPLVKYFLMAEEAKLTSQIRGTSSFADEFSRRGPKDAHGRSLRDLDLQTRLFRYPCSYLIYSPSFDALPAEVRDYILQKMFAVLTERDKSKEFEHLSSADRRAILEILRETKSNLLDYWHSTGDG